MTNPAEAIADELMGIGITVRVLAQLAGVLVACAMGKAAVVGQEPIAAFSRASGRFIMAATDWTSAIFTKTLRLWYAHPVYPRPFSLQSERSHLGAVLPAAIPCASA
jgi:hypothetical protein